MRRIFDFFEAVWEFWVENWTYLLLMMCILYGFFAFVILTAGQPDPCEQYKKTPIGQVPAECIGIFGGLK